MVRTPSLELRGATDELLEALIPVVRAGVVDGAGPLPFDDPMSLYEDSPQREWRWLQKIWSGRSRVSREWWRLYFVVMVDGQAVGVQDLTGVDFAALGTVETFSWLAPSARGRGIGREMRSAVLHLAFEGLGAHEAQSEAFVDNDASNNVSRALGYESNGTNWATRRGARAQLLRWKLTDRMWAKQRRDDIKLIGVGDCLPLLGLQPSHST